MIGKKVKEAFSTSPYDCITCMYPDQFGTGEVIEESNLESFQEKSAFIHFGSVYGNMSCIIGLS